MLGIELSGFEVDNARQFRAFPCTVAGTAADSDQRSLIDDSLEIFPSDTDLEYQEIPGTNLEKCAMAERDSVRWPMS
jgi:hypothetical protein